MLHKEAVTPQLFETLRALISIPHLQNFRLVGGTAIALQIGHRKSIDIDLFSNEKIYRQALVKELNSRFPGIECFVTDDSVNTRILDIKIDIYDEWMIPFMEPAVIEDGIWIASLRDLAAFKLTAFTERREKKDYIDLFLLFQKLGGLDLLKNYKLYNPNLSPKSLLFALEEAGTAELNQSPMPEMLIEVSWDEIKTAMHRAAKDFLKFLEEA